MKVPEEKALIAVLGVAVGWALKEVSEILRGRREDRKAVGKALADLLEIRLRLVRTPLALKEISSRLALGPEAQRAVAGLVSHFLPMDTISKRYEESVTLIAATAPILAFRLRSRDLVSGFVEMMRPIAAGDCAWQKVEAILVTDIVSDLDALLLELAWLHGIRTWYLTRRRLRATPELPASLLDSMFAAAQEMMCPEAPDPNTAKGAGAGV